MRWTAYPLAVIFVGLSCRSETKIGDKPDLWIGEIETVEVEMEAEVYETIEISEEFEPDTLPPKICRSSSVWHAGKKAFTDITKETNLPEMGVAGTRLGSVDFNNDGFPDLVVRNYYYERDDFSPNGKRYTFLLRNKGGFVFEDVTEKSGFTALRNMSGNGRVVHVVVWADVDNDGDLDAYTGVFTDPDKSKPDLQDRAEVMLNNGDGTFTLGPLSDIRHPDMRMPTMGATFTDYNRDGFIDIFVGYGMNLFSPEPDRLYRGDGTGAFYDITDEVGLMTKPWNNMENIQKGLVHRNTWGVSSCDLNNDGFPDLLCSVYGRYFNALYLGGENGFMDWSFTSNFASDDNKDWKSNMNAQCYCKLVPNAEDCDGVPLPPSYFPCSDPAKLRWDHKYDRQDWRLGGNTFSTVCGDINNDGKLDLLNLEIVHWDVGASSDPTQILINDGKAVFSRPGNEKMGLIRDFKMLDWNAGDMTGALFDFDNDGRLDILICSSDYPGTRAFLFHQKEDGNFEEVLPEQGIQHPRAHGVAIADFDLDGDLDVVLGHGLARCEKDPSCYKTHEVHVFRNEIGQDGNWIKIALEGVDGSNRSAIGARVEVKTGDHLQVQEVSGGYGHVGIQHDLTLLFGLGSYCEVDEIRIRWPDAQGSIEVFEHVRANYKIKIKQGDKKIQYLLNEK